MWKRCPDATPVSDFPAAESDRQRQCVESEAPGTKGFLSYQCSPCQGTITSFRVPQQFHPHDTPKAIPPLVTTGNHPEQMQESKRNIRLIPKCQGCEGQSPKLPASLWPFRKHKFPLKCLWPWGKRELFIWVIKALKNLCLHSRLSGEHRHKNTGRPCHGESRDFLCRTVRGTEPEALSHFCGQQWK